MTLILPDYLAEQEKQKSAYVKPEDRVLDPSKLPTNLKDRLPQPTGWRILILPYRGRAVTKGGIHIADETRERAALATVAAYVLKVGPDAYADREKFPAGPWCKEGQWILIGRYAGARFRLEDQQEIRIINDDEVIATIADPDDVVTV